MSELDRSKKKVVLRAGDADFAEGVRAALDFRGDVKIVMEDGSEIVGYVFHGENGHLDIFPLHGSQKESVPLQGVSSIIFGEEDSFQGKGWQDFVRLRSEGARLES
jgi:hypothetical protein